MQVVLQLLVGRGAGEQGVPGREDVVHEAGLRYLARADRAAEVVVSLEHDHTLAAAGQQRGAGERVDAAADDDHVERHAIALPRVKKVRLK